MQIFRNELNKNVYLNIRVEKDNLFFKINIKSLTDTINHEFNIHQRKISGEPKELKIESQYEKFAKVEKYRIHECKIKDDGSSILIVLTLSKNEILSRITNDLLIENNNAIIKLAVLKYFEKKEDEENV